jgi:hypothetical protein
MCPHCTRCKELTGRSPVDVCSASFFETFKHHASHANIKAIMLATPCNSFSLAVSRSGRALRSKTHPRGLPIQFTQIEQQRIRNGNKCLDATIAIIKVCNKFRIPWILENPQTSYIWSDSQLQAASNSATTVTVHQCAFGAKWRKATTFAFGNFQ